MKSSKNKINKYLGTLINTLKQKKYRKTRNKKRNRKIKRKNKKHKINKRSVNKHT